MQVTKSCVKFSTRRVSSQRGKGKVLRFDHDSCCGTNMVEAWKLRPRKSNPGVVALGCVVPLTLPGSMTT